MIYALCHSLCVVCGCEFVCVCLLVCLVSANNNNNIKSAVISISCWPFFFLTFELMNALFKFAAKVACNCVYVCVQSVLTPLFCCDCRRLT